MKKLSDVERAEQILTEDDMVEYVWPIDELPEPSEELLGKAYMLTGYQENYLLTKTYKCVKVDDQYEWKLINYHESNPTAPCTKLWATSVRDASTGRATVRIHWTDPEDTDDTHWAYTVVVKKLGSIPTSIYDGQVVGYSSVRNQYAQKIGMMDSIDIDAVDDATGDDDNDDIIDVSDQDMHVVKQERYYYNVFPVSKFNVIGEGTPGCTATLTWKKFQELIQEGIAEYALDIGDCVSVEWKYDGTNHIYIDFEVVAFDNADLVDESKQHSVTFMAKDVIFRGSFDAREEAYFVTADTTWVTDKAYYKKIGDEYSIIEASEISGTPATFGQPVYEKNPCSTAAQFGRNSWADSNARLWLNSTAGTDWFSKQHLHDRYDANCRTHSGYGFGQNINFVGFLGALDPDLQDVIAPIKVTTTVPSWKSAELTTEVTVDKVFFPSYVELFGREDENFPEDVSKDEGQYFDIYKNGRTNTRMKCMLMDFNTTYSDPEGNNLASWYMRSPVQMHDKQTINAAGVIGCIEIVTCENRRYDVTHYLGEDGGAGRSPDMPQSDNTELTGTSGVSTKSDRGRDNRNNVFKPVGSTLRFDNNSAPGFVPCFVVA